MAIPEPIQKLIPLDSPEEWNQALEGIPHSFTHTRDHCYAIHLTTGYPTYLYTLTFGDTRIVCPIAERPCGNYIEAVTPMGFSGFSGNGDLPEFPAIWEAFAQSRGYVTAYITLNPLFYRPSFTNPRLTHQHHTLYLIDLTPSEEDIFKSFSESRRRELRRWQESGVSVVRDRGALTRFFLEHYEAFFLEKGFPRSCFLSESSFASLLALHQVYLVGAATSTGLQGVLLCWYTPYAAEGIFSVRIPEGRTHVAGLIWSAAKHFRSLGIPVFNLGGGSDPNDNITSFKRRFHAFTMPLRAVRQIIRPQIFGELCREAGCDAGSEGYFPPYQERVEIGDNHV